MSYVVLPDSELLDQLLRLVLVVVGLADEVPVLILLLLLLLVILIV